MWKVYEITTPKKHKQKEKKVLKMNVSPHYI